jgi:hypothetical protein
VTLINSTITHNAGGLGVGGISNRGSTVTLQNTLLAGNTRSHPMEGPDCVGPITSLGHNLIGDPTGCTITLQDTDLTGDPGLGTFTDDGIPGHGHFPLLSMSPAINAGDGAACPRRDQLGARRHKPCDIGAIEFQDQDDRHHGDDSVATAQEPQ